MQIHFLDSADTGESWENKKNLAAKYVLQLRHLDSLYLDFEELFRVDRAWLYQGSESFSLKNKWRII